MQFLILLIGCLCHVTAVSVVLDYAWEEFKYDFNKAYDNDAVELVRRAIWESNLERIAEHNLQADIGMHKYWLKINHFGDMTTNEIDNLMKGLDVDDVILALGSLGRNSRSNVTKRDDGDTLPKHVDWRQNGYVTPVKYQGHCGSCYAFATTGALEGQHFKRTGRLVSLSEQNIVDCTESYGDHGCRGGLMDHAYTYIQENGGVDTETSYPYTADVEQCHFKKEFVGATCKGYKDIPKGDERALQVATATVGPISIGIDAHGFLFHFYSHGIYENPNCSAHKLNHGVLVVGYGTTEGGDEYWTVKNSWGNWWGEGGYINMSRNKDNQCGIASLASYPLV